MKAKEIEKKYLIWERCREEKFIYFLLLFSDCKTKEDFEEAFKNPYLKMWGFDRAIKQIIKTLPRILKNFEEAYKDETD